MGKTGPGAFFTGLILCAPGVYAIRMFLPDAIAAVKGLIGIVVLPAGMMLPVFAILIVKEEAP
jgi:hypothetical protein